MLNAILFTSYSGKNKILKRSSDQKIMLRRVHCRLIAEGDQGEGWGECVLVNYDKTSPFQLMVVPPAPDGNSEVTFWTADLVILMTSS